MLGLSKRERLGKSITKEIDGLPKLGALEARVAKIYDI